MAATTGELRVTVHAASDLQDTEQWGEMDPYAVLAFRSPPGLAAATKTAMKGGVNPEWQETLALPVTCDPGELLVQVFNQNRAAPDDLVGFGSIPVYDVLRTGGAELAVPLKAHPSGKQQGFVHMRLDFRPLPAADLAEAAARADMEAVPQAHAHDREPLPEVPGAQPTAEEAQQAPAFADLRPVRTWPPGHEKAYDRVHRPGYVVPGSSHT